MTIRLPETPESIPLSKALDAEGRPYANGDEIAMHTISIPLDRDA